mmetsp:Transcript_17274/g.51907  ORF Transcript_17274/g.51907 Transcript_17274/m.51907 type:complete len:204 (-) Transcript_17274:1316-1927(-)
MRRHDDALAALLKLRAARTSKDLLHVEHAQVGEGATLGVIHLCALDDHGVGRQVHTPGQRCRAHQDLYDPFGKEALRQRPVSAQHASVVHPKARLKKLHHLAVTRLAHVLCEDGVALVVARVEQRSLAVLASQIRQRACCLAGIFAAVHKHHGLKAALETVDDLVVRDLVHHRLARHEALHRDADELHLQRYGAVRRIKVEET